MYNKEMLYKLGQIYTSLLHVLNEAGKDPYPTSSIVPLKCFMMVHLKASYVGIPRWLEKEIGEFMDTLDVDIMDELETPVPMNLRGAWEIGCFHYKELGKIHPIRTMRKKRGLTQQELADKISAEQKDISRWETFSCKPSSDSLKKLSEALECSIDDIV